MTRASSAAADFGEDEMELTSFAPKLAGYRLQARNSSDNHSQEMFGFTRFFSAGADAEEELFA
jgi:hypothetical protein